MSMESVEEPAKWVCRLTLHFGDGKAAASGTGFLVNIPESNKFCIMTAAHNVILKGVGKVQEIQAHFPNGLIVTANRDECFASKVFESNPAESSTEESSFFDYGLIAVDKDKNSQGNLDPGGCAFSVLLKGHELLDMDISVYGYKKGEKAQTVNASGLDHFNNEALYYTKHTEGGVSGGPAFVVVNGIHTAVGIHTYPSRATRLTCRLMLEMLGWIKDYKLQRTLEISTGNGSQRAGVYLRATNGSKANIVARPGNDGFAYLNFVLAETPKGKASGGRAREKNKNNNSYLISPPQSRINLETSPHVLALVRKNNLSTLMFCEETHCERQEMKIGISIQGKWQALWFPDTKDYVKIEPSNRGKRCDFGCITQDQRVGVSSEGTRFSLSNPNAMTEGLSAMSGLPQLYLAVARRDSRRVKELIQQKSDVNFGCRCGTTALSKSAENGDLGIVNMLLRERAKLETINGDGESPNALALHNGHTDVVLRFRYYTTERADLLVQYATIGSLEKIQELLRSGLEASTRDSFGSSALEIAAQEGQKDAVLYLLRDGNVSPNDADPEGVTPLHRAAQYGHDDVIKILKDFDADPNVSDRDKMTPLHRAVEGGFVGAAMALCSGRKEAHRSPRGPNEVTPLMLAAQYGYNEVVELLLKLDADPSLTDSRGDTARDRAEKYGQDHIYYILSQRGR